MGPLPGRAARPPRYSDLPLPPYRFVPGKTPHPVRDPAGHSFGRREPRPPPWKPEEWRTLVPWLHAVDLYNRRYWWECHEVLEGLWHAAGRTPPHARFVKGVLHAAAAHLHRGRGNMAGAGRQAAKALACLDVVRRAGPFYMGVDLERFAADLRAPRDADPSPIELRG